MILSQQLLDEIELTLAHPGGAFGRMCDLEAERGGLFVKPGSYLPFIFPKDPWETKCIVNCIGRDVRIVLITAKRPGHGAFKQLVANIRAANLCPVVVAPIGRTMPAILAHWDWVETPGTCFKEADEWRPALSPR